MTDRVTSENDNQENVEKISVRTVVPPAGIPPAAPHEQPASDVKIYNFPVCI